MNRQKIGKRIGAFREKRHMSTQELARRIRRSQATISRIENGKQGLTFELLERLAAALDVHPFALLADEPLRYAVVTPSTGGSAVPDSSPTLVANALQGGRIRSNLRLPVAAEALGVPVATLEEYEAGTRGPDKLTERMCELYGLSFREMQAIKRFQHAAPDAARGLARLQRVFSRIYDTAKNAAVDHERESLDQIVEMLETVCSNNPLSVEVSPEKMGLFLDHLSHHLLSALKDDDFRQKLHHLTKEHDIPLFIGQEQELKTPSA